MAGKKGSVWEQFRNRSATLRRNFEKLNELLDELSADESLNVIRGVALIKTEAEEWGRVTGGTLKKMVEIASRMGDETQTMAEMFDTQLRRVLTNRGHTVHGDAALLIINGIVHVDINFDKGLVRVNGVLANDLEPALLADEIEREIYRLKKIVTPSDKLIREILRAYEDEVRSSGREFGAQIETAELLFRLTLLRQTTKFRANPIAGNFRGYPREVFRADLYNLIENGNLKVAGKSFRYASGSDTAGSVFMMVPALGRTAHIGRVWFESAGD